MRDKLYNTRERSRHLLTNGVSDIPVEATLTNVEQVIIILQKDDALVTTKIKQSSTDFW